jgi:hypothetical protein
VAGIDQEEGAMGARVADAEPLEHVVLVEGGAQDVVHPGVGGEEVVVAGFDQAVSGEEDDDEVIGSGGPVDLVQCLDDGAAVRVRAGQLLNLDPLEQAACLVARPAGEGSSIVVGVSQGGDVGIRVVADPDRDEEEVLSGGCVAGEKAIEQDEGEESEEQGVRTGARGGPPTHGGAFGRAGERGGPASCSGSGGGEREPHERSSGQGKWILETEGVGDLIRGIWYHCVSWTGHGNVGESACPRTEPPGSGRFRRAVVEACPFLVNRL